MCSVATTDRARWFRRQYVKACRDRNGHYADPIFQGFEIISCEDLSTGGSHGLAAQLLVPRVKTGFLKRDVPTPHSSSCVTHNCLLLKALMVL